MTDDQNDRQKNRLEFDQDYATWDVLQKRDLIDPEMEERIRDDLFGEGADESTELSDTLIAELARERLTQQGLEHVQVHAEGGALRLEGRVKDANAKQQVVAALETIPGVRSIHNGLQVED